MRARLIVLSLCAMIVTGLAVACLSEQRQPVAPTPDIASTVASAVSEAMGAAVSDPLVTPDASERLSSSNGDCGRTLRSVLVIQRGVSTADRVNSMIRQIQLQQRNDCSAERWEPVVSSAPLGSDGGCITREGDGNFGRVGSTNIPAEIGKTALNSDDGFARDPDGNMLVLFDEAGTVDHGRCWLYLAVADIWDFGNDVRASVVPRRPTFAYVLPPTYAPVPTFAPLQTIAPFPTFLPLPVTRVRVTIVPPEVVLATIESPVLPVPVSPVSQPTAFYPHPTVGHEEMLESAYWWPAPQEPLLPVASLPPNLAYIDDLPRPELVVGDPWQSREEYCAEQIVSRLEVGLAGSQDRRYCYAFYNAVVAAYDMADDDFTAESCEVARRVFSQSLEHYLPGFMTYYEALLPWVQVCPLPDDVGYLIDAGDYIGDDTPDVGFYRTPEYYEERADFCSDVLEDASYWGTTVRRAIHLCYVGVAVGWAYRLEVSDGGNHADGCREGRRVFQSVWDYHLPYAPAGADVVWMGGLMEELDCPWP